MSRSYKKHPFCKDWNSRKRVGKQLANQKVRAQLKRGIEIPSGKAYRKVFETWDIYDYHWYKPKSEVIKNFETKRFKYGPDTLEEAIDDWEKYYYRK